MLILVSCEITLALMDFSTFLDEISGNENREDFVNTWKLHV